MWEIRREQHEQGFLLDILSFVPFFTGKFVGAQSCNMDDHDINLTPEESTHTERFTLHKRIKAHHEAIDVLPFTLKHGPFQKNCKENIDEKSGYRDLHNPAEQSFVYNNHSISLEIKSYTGKHAQPCKAEDVIDYNGFVDPALLQVTIQEEGTRLHLSEKVLVHDESHTSLIVQGRWGFTVHNSWQKVLKLILM